MIFKIFRTSGQHLYFDQLKIENVVEDRIGDYEGEIDINSLDELLDLIESVNKMGFSGIKMTSKASIELVDGYHD